MMKKILVLICLSLNAIAMVEAQATITQQHSIKTASMDYSIVHYRKIKIDKLDIFYREAGPIDGPVILLMHGFPSSSFMFRNLINELKDRYHVIAPDYPGFGYSSVPDTSEFEYSFENLSKVMERFIDKLGIKSFSLYIQDYGAPIGLRLVSRRLELLQCLIVQKWECI